MNMLEKWGIASMVATAASKPVRIIGLLHLPPLRSLNLQKSCTKEEYLRLFRGSAVKRAKYDGFKRNIDAALNGIDEA